MKRIIIAAGLLLASYQSAAALDPSNGVTVNSLGECEVVLSVDSFVKRIFLRRGGIEIGYAKGGMYTPGTTPTWMRTPGGEFGVTVIETCLGGGVQVSNVNHYGGGAYADETKFGFDFTVGGRTYTYALVGATGTTWTGTNYAPNSAPVANAGPNQSVLPGATVTLDGTGSSDQDPNTTLTYQWTQTGGNINAALSDRTAAQPTFTASMRPGDFAIFLLTVSDGTLFHTDTVNIDVVAPRQTPATAFSAADDVIRNTLTADATRTLNSNVAVNQRMTQEARARFLQAQDPEAVGTGSMPVDVDGSLEVDGVTVSSKGLLYGYTGMDNGAGQLVFGDFDIQRDGNTGSSTATLNGRVAWEYMLSEKTMLGYFIGGELALPNIAGDFDGSQNRVGVSLGGYAVHELADRVLLDGYFSLGAGRNNLEMTDTVLALTSDYTTHTAIVGAALSGVIEQDGFEVWPELSLNYGRTWIGNVGFSGRAYSLVDDTLSIDVGQVTMASVMLRPEFRVPLDGLSGANSLPLVTFAPRLMCEQIKAATTEDNCGGGAEVGFSSRSADGLSSVSAKVLADRIGGSTKSSLQLSLQHQF